MSIFFIHLRRPIFLMILPVTPAGLEPATCGLEGGYESF
jgi:hypothetical protein